MTVLKKELYDFQREDVERFKRDEHKAGLWGYDMALGKTLTSVTLAMELGVERVLVIAPQVTFHGWESAVHSQSEGTQKLRWLKKSTKAGQQALEDYYAGKPGWYFITWGLLRNGTIFETRVDMAIADEIHEAQNKGGSAQNIELGNIFASYKLGLSGTASGNKLAGIFGVISWLWPSRYKSYWKWLQHNFLLAGFGHALTPIREKSPGMVTSDLPFYVRRLKEDHYADMVPEPYERKEVVVSMTPEQQKIYQKLDETSGTWLDDGDDPEFLFTQFGIVKMARLREIALGTPVMIEEDGRWLTTFKENTKSAKLDALIDILESPEMNGETAVVYTHSKKFIDVVVKRLNARGITARAFTGDLTYAKKRKAIDELGEKYRVMVATQASVGTGTDGLQYKSRNLIILSRDIKATTNTQARDRLYRPGQTERMRTWEIIAEGSNDLDTNANLDYDEEVVNSMLNATKLS